MSIKALAFDGGHLDQVRDALKLQASKLTPKRRIKLFSQLILEPLSKGEVNDNLSIIERLKSVLSLAVANDTVLTGV